MEKELINNSQSNIYPFHMPGHKRRGSDIGAGLDPYAIDITEIDNFDNLHHAEGIIKEAQAEAAALYGAKRAYFLINGSTCGILAAISAATKMGDKVLVARNCHKAVYHALYLRQLHPVFTYPEITRTRLQGQITEAQIRAAFDENPDIKAVVITSPTYDGVVSDVAAIASVAHAHGALLVVDEAHGAHFGFGGGFPQNAIALGADAVIVSLHKTLPAFTQTAVLCVGSGRVDSRVIKIYTDIYVSTSPSYLLTASVERCMDIMESEGAALHAYHYERMAEFREKCRRFKHLRLFESSRYDMEKVVICTDNSDINGNILMRILRDKYHLEAEMASAEYVIAMTSCMDTDEGIDRLYNALLETDNKIHSVHKDKNIDFGWPVKVHEPWEIDGHDMQMITAEDAAGRVCAEYVYIYPPGVPWVVPGEMVSDDILREIKEYAGRGFEIRGITADGMIPVTDD